MIEKKQSWLAELFCHDSGSHPFLIAGPCGAESPEQLLHTASFLKSKGVALFRAGVWKARSRPDSFQGHGSTALQWLKDMRIQLDMPFAIEVASAEHVEEALRAESDCIWIGARSTVNPFMVQEIADSLKGIDIPVLIKNPVNPDLELWQGAIERFYNNGLPRIAAIHRGFSSYENTTYRNKPNWEIPIELKRRLPDLPLICDPSHIGGKRNMILFISQIAMDLNFNGLMIEVHPDPDRALSDPKQQLSFEEFEMLLNDLIVRNVTTKDVFELSKLEDLRDQIDEIDQEVINTLAKRMQIARAIGTYKEKNNITIYQPDRWREIIETRTLSGLQQQLSKEFLVKLYRIIHQESIEQQSSVMMKEKKSTSGSNL